MHKQDCSYARGACALRPMLPPLPVALSGSCGALVGEWLIVEGGAETPGEQIASHRAFALDLAAGNPAGFHLVEKHPGFPKSILAYDPALDRWSDAGETPAPRATVSGVEWSGIFVVPSGEVRPGVRSAEVWGWMHR